ncbi:restriction endonuclease subunit S [Desulfosarcina sp. OttesenSCG-928-A07]|nr:restriction endonuclease subunit S [Desulfosarcina sp. OttesenSCG-928-G17]MDL2328855.1 restriction endonuclease subunit S [Desulfosarcina sp. OttesenSCG-928-A07]
MKEKKTETHILKLLFELYKGDSSVTAKNYLNQYTIKDIANISVGRDLVESAFSKKKTATHKYPVYSNSVENKGLYGFYDFEEYPGSSLTIVGRGVGLGTAFPRKESFGAIGRLLVLSPKNNKFDVRYLAEYINNKLVIFNESGGIPQLPGESLAKYKVELPSLPEQKAIVDLLATWDEAIEKTERLIQAKEKRFKWLMRKLISEPQNAQKGVKWKRAKLGEIGEISSAGVDKTINEKEVPVRLVNYLDVYRRNFIYSSDLNHQVTAPKEKAKKCSVRQGDVFFTPSSETRHDIGHSAVVMEDMPDVVYSYHIVRLRLHESFDLRYRAYAFKSEDFFRQAQKAADGSGQRYVISQSGFRKIEILFPPFEIQQQISDILFTAQQEIDLLKQVVEKYKVQKRGLMQKMLTGEWRIKPETSKL